MSNPNGCPFVHAQPQPMVSIRCPYCGYVTPPAEPTSVSMVYGIDWQSRALAAEAQVATLTRQLTEAREEAEAKTQLANLLSEKLERRTAALDAAEAQRDGAVKALELYDAWLALPQDRGGNAGPKGQTLDAFIKAKDAILASQEASTVLDVKGEGKLGASVANSAGEEPDGSFASDRQCKSEGSAS